MKLSHFALFKGTIWTVGCFGIGQLLRLATNIILTRLLAPELFGIIAIANSIRLGVELLSDIGIGQNIVHSANGEKPEFYNTAWTIGLIRGVVLWIVCSAAAIPLAHFYNAPILGPIIPIYAFLSVIAGLCSIGPHLLTKRMQYARINILSIVNDSFSAIVHIVLVYLNPTIWMLVFAGLVAFSGRLATSYIAVPGIWHRICLSKEYASQIVKFGRWIFISSAIFFFSMHFDRLYMGKAVPLAVLGIYGIARNLSDLFGAVFLRLGSVVVFPLISSSSASVPRSELRGKLALMRISFLLLTAMGLSVFAALADLLIKLLYDQRYESAGWMLSVFCMGAWVTIICNLNEANLLGFGVPRYNALANGVKFVWLLIGLPLAFFGYGLFGAVVVVASSDVFRYAVIAAGQVRERFSFLLQDLASTFVLFGLVALWEGLRWKFGLGTSFGGIPFD